jgi:hypothetical protein
MKKLLIGFIVFSLVLFILPAVVHASPKVEIYSIGDSKAEWSTEEKHEGDHSVKLLMRDGWWDTPNNNAEVQIYITGNPKISDIDNWSYWVIAPDKYTVPIELNIDTTGGNEINKVLYATKAGNTPSGWFEFNQDSGHWWYGSGSPDNWEELKNWVNTNYSNATLVRVDLGYGPLGSNTSIDAYVDDFKLDGVSYSIEPEPVKPPPVEPEPEEEIEKPKPIPIDKLPVGRYEATSSGFTTLFYNRLLQRPPEQDGLDVWIERLESGEITGADLVKSFIFGEECQARISEYTNEEFITFLYWALFNRAPEEYGFNAWLERMAATMTREDVVEMFTQSEEFVNTWKLFGITPYAGYTENNE